ncbi:MAG: HIT domain-containing protein [Rickettsiaceae bacterium]
MYNKNNVFAKIINNEVNSDKIYEDDSLLVIKDIKAAAPIHLLVIPKGNYTDLTDFVENASNDEIAHYFKMIAKIAKENDALEYRIVSNKGESAGQSVFHFHTHILSGSTNINLIDKTL